MLDRDPFAGYRIPSDADLERGLEPLESMACPVDRQDAESLEAIAAKLREADELAQKIVDLNDRDDMRGMLLNTLSDALTMAAAKLEGV